MPIKFCCPNCKKALRAREEQAGKKVRCPGCRRILTLADAAHSEEMETLAAAALADPALEAPAPELGTVKFHCMYCDEEVEVAAELAGKQTPCTHCRRIIKVPVQAKNGPRDWRKVDPRRPGGGLLRDAEAAPEGAWGSTAARRVSQQALVEAEVIPVAVERLSAAQWTARILIGMAALVVAAAVGWSALHWRTQSHQQNALARALEVAAAPETKLDDLAAAEVFRGAGEYYFRDGRGKQARESLGKAHARLSSAKASAGRDALAIDLLVDQIDLGARTKAEVADGSRIVWDELFGRDIRQALGILGTPDGRAAAIRAIARKLVQRDAGGRVESCVHYMNMKPGKEQTEILAAAALELMQGGQAAAAANLAAKLTKPYEQKAGKAADSLPPMGPCLTALIIARSEQQKVGKNLPELPPAEKPLDQDVRLGYVDGWACQGKWAEALQAATRPGTPAQRVEALVTLARRALDKGPEEARQALETAVGILEAQGAGDALSPWMMLELARGAAKLGLADRLRPAVQAMSDPNLRARALIEVERGRPAATAKEALEQAVQEPAHPLLIEFLARRNAQAQFTSSSLFQEIGSWVPANLQPFGYLGLALGEQDGGT